MRGSSVDPYFDNCQGGTGDDALFLVGRLVQEAHIVIHVVDVLVTKPLDIFLFADTALKVLILDTTT